jgi:hypothetical protein
VSIVFTDSQLPVAILFNLVEAPDSLPDHIATPAAQLRYYYSGKEDAHQF